MNEGGKPTATPTGWTKPSSADQPNPALLPIHTVLARANELLEARYTDQDISTIVTHFNAQHITQVSLVHKQRSQPITHRSTYDLVLTDAPYSSHPTPVE